MLAVSLDCPFFLPLRYSLKFICLVSCVPYVASFSGVSFLLPLRYSLTFICSMFCLPYVASFSGLSFFFAPSVFSKIYLFYVLLTLCCQFLWIFFFFVISPSVFSNIDMSRVLCTLCCQFLWIFLFIAPSVLLHIYLSCLFVYPMLPISLDCPFLLPLRYSVTYLCPVSCVPYIANLSELPFVYCPFGIA
jgi:hypothetical protein